MAEADETNVIHVAFNKKVADGGKPAFAGAGRRSKTISQWIMPILKCRVM